MKMKLNDKQVLLSIKALSHYINTALQFVPNDDEEKVHARVLLQCMEDSLLGNSFVSECDFEPELDHVTLQPIKNPSCLTTVQVDDVLSTISRFIVVSSMCEPGDCTELYVDELPKRIDLRLDALNLRIDDIRYVAFDGTIVKFGQCIDDGIVWHTFEAVKPMKTWFAHGITYEIVYSKK